MEIRMAAAFPKQTSWDFRPHAAQQPQPSSSHSKGKGKRPYKVWDSGRQIRKGLVVSSFNELIEKGREKLELGEVRIKVVLEADGTQVEDAEYFGTLPENTVFLLLRQGEHWYPAGVEVLRQASSSPRKPSTAATRVIVSGVGESTIHRHDYLVTQSSIGSTPSPAPISKSPVPAVGAAGQPVHGTITTILRDGKKETLINDIGPPSSAPPLPSHQATVINHDPEHKSSYMGGSGGVASAAMVGRLSRQGSSVESSHSATVHIHTPECCQYGHPHTPQPRTRASPTGDQAECDFHCCSLHEEGGRIQASGHHHHHHHHLQQQPQQPPAQQPQVHKAVATSPVQEGAPTTRPTLHHIHTVNQSPGTKSQAQAAPTSVQASVAAAAAAAAAVAAAQKGSSHVRFQHDYRSTNLKDKQRPEQESSESETENTTNDEEAHTTEKFLLLTDQLSVDTKKHLSIKDIGVILDRLSSKIIDVEKLDREAEEEDCFNWTIKATIRGDSLRELGVVYNGHYYSISEHPGYGQKKEDEEEEEEEGNNTEEKESEKEPV
ncbi:hypothetical protein SK128_022422 [Halocaridina rubra]|uniref:CIDE-N domain-containing protein n=1 Tax=Halocaridina rubra TaxID=373956 RepID=A0AAN8WIZ0_HALRR